jgi:uncharacterized membrane protein YheB (UPF0754 family)
MLRTRGGRMKFIIPVLTGAVIGYITNWLAIKMLFRPLNEVRIFGIKVPFTPGLIPKERNRIAKSIGDAVGTHLLNPETLAEALCGEKVRKQIGIWIRIKIKEIREKNTTIKELTAFFTGEKYCEFIQWLKQSLADIVYRYLISTEGREAISSVIKKQAEKIIDNALEKGEAVSKTISRYISDFAASDGAKYAVEEIVGKKLKGLEYENNTLKNIIPEEAVDALKDHIYRNDSSIAKMIGDVVKIPSISFSDRNSGFTSMAASFPRFCSTKPATAISTAFLIEGVLTTSPIIFHLI